MIALAQTNETIDGLVWRVLKSASTSLVCQVLELNPNLNGAAILPAGQSVILPDNPQTTNPAQNTITLWD